MSAAVETAQRAARQAQAVAMSAVRRWSETRTAEDEAAMEAAVRVADAAQDRADDMADRWEANEASRDVQADWWVAAKSNARCVA